MLLLQQLTLKVSVIQKNFCQSKHCLHSGLSKLFLHFQKLFFKSNPEFKWLSEVVKMMFMFVGDVVAATINTYSICHTKILLSEQTLLTQWSVRTFFAISEISFEE